MEEIWKDVEGFEGVYKISNLGNIRSLDRVVEKTNYSKLGKSFIQRQKIKGKALIPSKDKYGYMRLSTQVMGERCSFKVHRLVAEAFIPNPNDDPCVNHINGVKDDNRITNLEWCTYSENYKHAVDNSLIEYFTGENAFSCKYETKVFDMKGNYLYSLYGHKEVKDKGFDPRLVHAVSKGKRLHHKNHKFEKVKINKENK